MVDCIYSYISTSLLMLAIWFIVYIIRKDTRKEMLFVSTILAVFGAIPIALGEVFIWTKDWWSPKFIMGMPFVLEDIILVFALGGIGAVIYEQIFKKKLYKRRKHEKLHTLELYSIFTISVLILFIAFFGLGWHSFYATTLAMLFPGVYIIARRNDLFLDALVSGLIITFLGFVCFWFARLVTPGCVEQIWFLNQLSGLIIFGAVFEDLIWFFLVGFVVGPLYEFWQGARLKPL